MTDSNDYYDILGLSYAKSLEGGYSDEEVKKAYLLKAKQWHPDVNHNSSEAKKRFQRIAQAYEGLKDHSSRLRYQQLRSYPIYKHTSHPFYTQESHPFEGYDRNYYAAQNNVRYSTRSGTWTTLKGLSLFILPLFGVSIALWFVTSNNSPPGRRPLQDREEKRVEAWFNPRSQRWETPAPWNPLYQQISSQTPNKQIPKSQVSASKQE